MKPEDAHPEDAHPEDAALADALRASRRMHDAPEALVLRAIALFDARAGAAAPSPSVLQRLAAVLRFDSAGLSPLAFGRRSAGTSLRQLVYTVQGHDVDLRVADAGAAGSFTLSGQVLGRESLGIVRLLDEAGQQVQAVALSELGEFRLAPVAPGTYRMTLELSGIAIDLPPVQLPLPA